MSQRHLASPQRLSRSPGRFQVSVIAASLACALSPSWAADYFNPRFLGLAGEDTNVDLSAFSEVGGMAEEEYTTAIYINQRAIGADTLWFKQNAQGRVVPQLTPKFLESIGVNVAHLAEFKDLPPDEPIDDLSALIPQATTKLDLATLRLDISVPQVAMQPNLRGWSDPSLWDDGIPALLTNYNFSVGETKNKSKHGPTSRNTNAFASFRSGLNIGPWRLRSTYTQTYTDSNHGSSETRRHFDSTSVSRDIRALRSILTMGEVNTGSEVFDGVQFRGMKLESSEEMLPDQLRGFAPNISGVATSNARVTVRQNGNTVYETYVAPGPFNLTDINQGGLSGDYDVTVTESDGTEHQFIVPYSSLPMMLRPGGWKYELSGGRYDGGYTWDSRGDDFMLGTGAYGFQNNFTLYGGALVSKDYQSFSAGSGVSLGQIGALSADITSSSAQFDHGSKKTGQSYRVRYSKSMLSTGTTVDLTALRYSTEHYYNFSEFNSEGFRLRDGVSPWTLQRRRSSFQTQLSQNFDQWGSLYFRANRDDYWGSSKTMTGMSVGYSNNIKRVNFNLNYNIDRMKETNGNWPENRQISMNVSIPFSVFSESPLLSSTYATTSIMHDNHGKTTNSAGLSGSLGNSNVSYGLSQSWGNQGQVSQSNANLSYQGSKGSINTGYGYSSDTQSLNLNASGGAIIHTGGITLSKTLGDSVALIHTPSAAGVSVNNGNGVTDWFGYAVAPYLTNYTQNSVGIDPSTLPDGVDITQTNANVYPTKGAVVKVTFATRVGHQVLITLTRQNTKSLVPFGAIATLERTASSETDTTGTPDTLSSIVGDAGQVYLTGLPEAGTLNVKWGNEADQQCTAHFDLASTIAEGDGGILQASVACLSSAPASLAPSTPVFTPTETPSIKRRFLAAR